MIRKLFHCVIAASALMTSLSAWAHDGDHSYTNGICTIDGCTDKYQAPELVDGWYEVQNAGQVEWISDYVQNVAINPNVKMMNDIDFTGVDHTMIGRNDARKFNGIWDGQGHRITNLVLNYGNNENPKAIGFFAWVRGGSTIKNLIMDKTCYFEGKVRVAAFVGVTQVANGGPVRIENCVNEANVKGYTGATGGFIGCRNPDNQDTPQAIISGCANHGNILCDANEAAAFVGWANGSGHIVENSYNTGNINSDGDKRGFIRAGESTVTNSYDFGANKDNNNQKASYTFGTDDPITSGELAFVINQQVSNQVFYQNLETDVDAYPVPFATHGQVYAHGNYRCDGVALPGTYYDNTYSAGAVLPPHNYNANGICQNDGCTAPAQRQEPTTDADGWLLLSTVGHVEWLSDQVNGSYVAKAKLVADIDFENKVNIHAPIGPSTGSKFKGEFDGQGHHIKNMIINRPNDEGIGFFGWLQGNATTYIHDLIIDRSCSITAMNKAGGLAGASQNEGGKITLKNIVLGADVTVSGQDAAGLVGGESGNKATYDVQNIVNLGTIKSTHSDPYVGALFCYQERGTVKNFINLGTIIGHNGGNIGRFQGSKSNIVDLSDTENKTEYADHGLVAADIASGKLAYYMNDKAEAVVFYQTLGTDAYPVPFADGHLQVYAHGTFRCDGESTGELTYDNTQGADVIPPHNYSTDGFCQNAGCTKPNEAPETDNDGWLLLKNAGTVEWLSDKVEAEGGNYVVKAKLTADINFGGTENLHQPIGRREGAKFKGEFDGQGHRIKGMVINRPENEFQGFFGYLQGNAPGSTIRNLIIDATCSVTAKNKAAGVAGNVQNSSGTITFENVVNEADVTVTGSDAGGILGGEQNEARPTFAVRNIVNTGTITSASLGGGIFCWQGNGTAENVINLGKVVHLNGEAGHGNLGHFDAGWTNAVDVSETEFTKTDGVVDGLTLADAANGKLAYYMNMMACSEVFFQTIGTDAYPMPFNTSAQVYGHVWDGTAKTIVAENDDDITITELTIDDTWQNFYTPTTVDITAKKVNYSRTNVAGLNTVCLPFALNNSMLPDGIDAAIYEVGTIGTSTITLNKVDAVDAGKPCLVWFPTNYTSAWDITVNADTKMAEQNDNGALKGSYTTKTIGAGKYKLNADGKSFGQTTDAAEIYPFRAYIETASTARELTIDWESTTGIEDVNAKAGLSFDCYDLQGRKVQNLNRTGLVIINGKKVFVNK